MGLVGVVHVEERLLGASAEAIAYPIERLSRTNRTVLKTAVTGSYADAIAYPVGSRVSQGATVGVGSLRVRS